MVGKICNADPNHIQLQDRGRQVLQQSDQFSTGDNIYITDECEWNGKEPINCTYTQRQGDKYNMDKRGYRWSTEGTSKFVWQDGTIVRTTKANGKDCGHFRKGLW